jgi:hypothetical protein
MEVITEQKQSIVCILSLCHLDGVPHILIDPQVQDVKDSLNNYKERWIGSNRLWARF